MLKKIELPGVCRYEVDTETGDIFTYKNYLQPQIKTIHYEKRNHKGRVRIWFNDGHNEYWYACYLILRTVKEPRNQKLYRCRFIDGNYKNLRPDNLEWERRENVSLWHILDEGEYKMWVQKLDSMNQMDWIGFNELALKRIFECDTDLDDPLKRAKLLQELFKIQEVKQISDINEVNLI